MGIKCLLGYHNWYGCKCSVCGKTRIVKIEMVFVEGGTFKNNLNASVSVSGFYIGKYPVTQKEYEKVMGKNPSNFKGENNPVEKVSWYEAVEFCNKMSEIEGLEPCYKIDKTKKDPNNKNSLFDDLKYSVTCNFKVNGCRLATDAEWEYAAKGGNKSKNYKYSGSNNLDDVGWYDMNSKRSTHQVGLKMSNELGIYDMSGNVWEWCWDWSDLFGAYSSTARSNPTGPTSGSCRVLRGGIYYGDASLCDVANCLINSPDYSSSGIGFRISRTP